MSDAGAMDENGGIENVLAEEVAWRGLLCRGCGHALNQEGFCPPMRARPRRQ